jgi:type I restriction enzyme S subunit
MTLTNRRAEQGQPLDSNWRCIRLADVAERITVGLAISVTEHYCDDGIPLIRNQNICDGWFDGSDIVFVDPEFAASQSNKTVRNRDVLTVRTGANIGQTCVVPDRFAGSQTFTTLITSTKRQELLPEYLSFHMQSPLGIAEIDRLQIGGGKGNLNAGHLADYRIDVPPLNEQHRIVEVFQTWDKAIHTLPTLIAAKLKFKQGLMQQLLTGQRRFKQFKDEWRRARIADVAHEISERNSDGDFIPVLSCTNTMD